jgi:hypothetical protein
LLHRRQQRPLAKRCRAWREEFEVAPHGGNREVVRVERAAESTGPRSVARSARETTDLRDSGRYHRAERRP